MKKITLSTMLWASLLLCLNAQTFKDEKTYTFDVANLDLLRVHNKYGAVKVTGTNGNKAVLTVKRSIKSNNNKQLAEAKEKIYLDSTYLDGELMFFVQMPNYRLEIDENGRAHYQSDHNSWNNNQQSFYKNKFELTIELTVPKATQLYISTHHKDLFIQDINADVLAQNHHGHIRLASIGGNVQAHTHHGKIEVGLTKVPTRDAYFDTHHGNISVTFPQNLAAEVALSTRHGQFYTDFDYKEKSMPLKISNGKKGTKYKIGGGTGISIGNGGPKLTFETYHGSIYLLK